MVVINDTLGVRGGTMTLMYRMCRWYVENGEEAAVLYEADGNEEIISKIEALGVKTFYGDYFNLKKRLEILRALIKEAGEIKVINYNLNHYMDIEYVRSKYNLPIKNIMYVIHPDCLKKGQGINNSILRKKYQDYYYRIISRMIKNNALIFMDTDTINATKAFYNKPLPGRVPIIPLPIDIPKVDDVENLIITGYERKTILTASRADFPFKGYLLGLVDIFKDLKIDCPDAKLKIFSDGEDIDKLKKKINSLNEDVRRDVELCGWIDYDGLLNQIKESRVFIGMATGLLDSSKNYRVSIPVKHSTNSCISQSFFYESPLLLVEEYKKGMNDRCAELMKTIFKCTFDEYRNMSQLSFDAVNKNYNENVVMNQLDDAMQKNVVKNLNTVQIVFHGTYQFLNKYRFKSPGGNTQG